MSSLFLLEAPEPTESIPTLQRSESERTVHIVDNLLALSMNVDGDLTRSVRILKSRGSAHDGTKRTLRIGPRGLEVERGA